MHVFRALKCADEFLFLSGRTFQGIGGSGANGVFGGSQACSVQMNSPHFNLRQKMSGVTF